MLDPFDDARLPDHVPADRAADHRHHIPDIQVQDLGER
jgi:hypothetical protein